MVKVVPNITISIPKELYDKMKRHPEIRWSAVIRRFLERYLMRLEGRYEMRAGELLDELGIEDELVAVSDEVALRYAEEMVKKRGKRVVRY